MNNIIHFKSWKYTGKDLKINKFRGKKIITETIDYLMTGIERIMAGEIKTGVFNSSLSNTGGGILGALFATLFCIAIAFRCLQLPYNTVVQTVGHFKETQNRI